MGGQVIGVGAGQQSRVDCVKLAGRKVAVGNFVNIQGSESQVQEGCETSGEVNARVRYIGDMTPQNVRSGSHV